MRKPILAVFLALIACLTLEPLHAESAAPPAAKALLDYVREARTARLAGDYEVWRDAVSAALKLAPEHPDLLLSAARAESALDNQDVALQRLSDAVNRGAGLDLSVMPELERLNRWQAFKRLADHARKNTVPVARATMFAQLRKDSQSEGIAYDPVSQRLFAGSVQGEIFAIDHTGAVSVFVAAGTGLREVYGMKVDAERRLLWVATSVFPDLVAQPGAAPKPDLGLSGLYAFSLTDGRVVTARWLNDNSTPHGFNDVALAASGDVYVTDSATGAVYVLRSGAPAIELFVRAPNFTFPNGIVMTRNQRYLIVATVEGLNRIDAATRAVTRLRVPDNASVNSIDGLAWSGDALVGVQGSPYMSRTIKIVISDDATAVRSVAVLNSFTPREYSFTTAAVGGGQVYVVGGAPAVDAQGKPLATAPQPQIVRLPLPVERRETFSIDLPFEL
jgi:hypothetical protein